MSKEKQIEEMARVIAEVQYLGGLEQKVAQLLFERGYRKQTGYFLVKENGDIVPIGQNEGEWVSNRQTDEYICSLCGAIAPVDCEKEEFYKSNYCPNCGAKMNGGAE